jgi:hypothetical protein
MGSMAEGLDDKGGLINPNAADIYAVVHQRPTGGLMIRMAYLQHGCSHPLCCGFGSPKQPITYIS